jgi:excisionase family DNA binding protein
MTMGSNEHDALPPALTVPEVARLLRVHTHTVYGLIQRGELPGARKVGRVIRIGRDPFLAWLAEGGTAQNTTAAPFQTPKLKPRP